jgi:chaperone BCS1
MTTNHREKLDPALIRPGRVDFDIEIGYMNTDGAHRLFQLAYDKMPKKAFPKIEGLEVTPSQILEFIKNNLTDSDEAERLIRQFLIEKRRNK